MKTRMLIAPALLATAALAVPGAAHATSATPRITDIGADLSFDGRVELDVETTGASRVHVTYRGRTVKLRKGEFDREDRTRDWFRTVRARSGDASGNVRVELRVRACKGDRCVTRTGTEFLEREDD